MPVRLPSSRGGAAVRGGRHLSRRLQLRRPVLSFPSLPQPNPILVPQPSNPITSTSSLRRKWLSSSRWKPFKQRREDPSNALINPTPPISTPHSYPRNDTTLQYEFPPQEVALQFVVEAIQAEAFNTNALFLIGTYTIGKEKVFLEAAKALKRKVYVGAVKRRLLACLGLSNDDMAWVAGDGEEASTNLHAVPLWSISSFKRIEHIAKFHRQRYSTIIAFSPSGWAFDKCKKARPIRRTQRGTIV
ncbi:unnamed protein product, partial [Closterium sp. NIES-54]